jgi:hypothetical protein
MQVGRTAADAEPVLHYGRGCHNSAHVRNSGYSPARRTQYFGIPDGINRKHLYQRPGGPL